MIAHYLLQADMRHNMTVLAETYLNYSPIKIEAIIGRGKAQLNMRDLPAIKIKDYACEDADILGGKLFLNPFKKSLYFLYSKR